ncbi:MAG: hypothetical protein H8E44_16085 [Planctomycetes bacterium]|nr:hypothetical protein [Planctomycetota bacterium]
MQKYMALWFATIALAAVCCAAERPKQKPERILPQDKTGNFVLHVSNQSFAITPVDVTIHIDGKRAVAGNFEVEDQHNWVKRIFRLQPGKHKLVVVSKKGQAKLEKEFEIKDKHWAVINYWYYPKSHYNPTPKHFSFNIQNKPIYFQ